MSDLTDLEIDDEMRRKLAGFGPVYYINLDDDKERRRYMENQFRDWGIDGYTRISAYPGAKLNLFDLVDGEIPDSLSPPEIACIASHLKMIKTWYENDRSEYAVFCEDDVDFIPVKAWPFDWQYLISRVPYNWDALQLSVINPRNIVLLPHRRFPRDWSTGCYVVTRGFAKKILNFHIRGEKYKFDNGVRPELIVENLIFGCGITYTAALFLYNVDFQSNIHQKHVDDFHRPVRDKILNWWSNLSDSMTPEEFFTPFNIDS